ncbi:NAD-dependent epimerase/dehydratase family protein [Asticcacaulis excentricus]|uniref:NAD-dependent epimerase/dehydratase n=1 Tax=Asticcacaulis excentricus (strain ATCC 15261 / DSM 4724 / KCTC 12464 / NCIMB 9791 / VKM B-1370 / CB 48) TaxID=573065 RepID=E8RNP5_ASTEC|nr:NAD-dependent epimerase/dehydratase family protein [Asticcacaulis excentricus]ADU12941.1 NAD-dependent epimerase/dehydratase [Asticcacaulis excentricus CB 48]
MRVFITGTAGFIGFHLAQRLLTEGHTIHGYDGMTEYYDVRLKRARVERLKSAPQYTHTEAMLENMDALMTAAEACQPEIIIHLAAQAGVRYSLEQPRTYVNTNVIGSFNILEVARLLKPQHLLLASTSSVYGANEKVPFEEVDKTDEPMTLYAATKKSMEVMAHSYAHLWKIPTTAFRFFTVYGPYGRPDMALFKFVNAADRNEAIDVYGMGQHARDFTYIDDLVEAIVRLIPVAPSEGNRVPDDQAHDTLSKLGPFRVVNLGGGQPVSLLSFIDTIEEALQTPLKRNMLPMQKGDVPRTYASTRLLQALTGFLPRIGLKDGVTRFVNWFRAYNVKS